MSSTSATSPSRPSRHGRAKSTLSAFQPRPTDDEPLDHLELVRRFDRLTNSRLAKEKSSFHHLYVPDEAEPRRPGLVDGFLWLAERIFVGPPPETHKREHSGTLTSSLTEEILEPEPVSASEPDLPVDEPQLDGEQQLLRTSEEQGWQRCPAPDCGHMIELTEGCMRVKCRCGTMFCYGCGEPWKTCSCPLWDATVVDGDYRRSFDETGEELEDWELVGEDQPRVAEVAEEKPSVPEVKIPYYFEEGGITMPGGLFTMVPTKSDTEIMYSAPETYTANPTSSSYPPDDIDLDIHNDNDFQFSESGANSPALDEPTGQAPPGEASSSNQRDIDLVDFEEGDDPFHFQDRPGPTDLPPRYATLDQGVPSGPSFPIPDTSASTSGLGYGHGYGYPAQHDGFEKWDGTPPLDDKKTSAWVEGNRAQTNSPPPDSALLGGDLDGEGEGEGDDAILGASIRRTGTPSVALVNPHDQKKMTNIRSSARKRFSIDGTNGRKDLTEKDPLPRSNSTKVLENEEDQAKMDEIRQNSQKLTGKAKADNKPKLAAPTPNPAWGKKIPTPGVSPSPSGSPAPKAPRSAKPPDTPTPTSQNPTRASPAPVAKDGVTDVEKDKDKETDVVTARNEDPIKGENANEVIDPAGEGGGGNTEAGNVENKGEEHMDDSGEKTGVDAPGKSNEDRQDNAEEGTTSESGAPGNNAEASHPPDATASSADSTITDKAGGDQSEQTDGQITANNAEASDLTNTAASATDGVTNVKAGGDNSELNDDQAIGDAATTQAGERGEGSGDTGETTSNPVSPNPDNVNTPQTASTASPEITTAGGGGQGGEDQDGVLSAVPILKKKRNSRKSTKR